MRYLIFTILLCWLSRVQAQPKQNKFHIVDADTKAAIPYASVSLQRANLAMNTETDGLLSIPGDLSKLGDIVFISAQNYVTLRTLLSKLDGQDTIRLKKMTARPLVALPVLTGKDSVINKFNWHDVSYFAGIHTEYARFEYLQMAQEFDTPVPGAALTKVFICRLAHWLLYPNKNSDNQYRWVDLEHTRFRLRFYDVDLETGGPGRDLTDQIIEVKNNTDQNLTINLKDQNIVIPGKKFFVAIQWLRTFDNAGYATERSERNLIYKPTLGILPYKTDKLRIWGLTYGHQWKPYTYFSPDWTDLAISATVKW